MVKFGRLVRPSGCLFLAVRFYLFGRPVSTVWARLFYYSVSQKRFRDLQKIGLFSCMQPLKLLLQTINLPSIYSRMSWCCTARGCSTGFSGFSPTKVDFFLIFFNVSGLFCSVVECYINYMLCRIVKIING